MNVNSVSKAESANQHEKTTSGVNGKSALEAGIAAAAGAADPSIFGSQATIAAGAADPSIFSKIKGRESAESSKDTPEDNTSSIIAPDSKESSPEGFWSKLKKIIQGSNDSDNKGKVIASGESVLNDSDINDILEKFISSHKSKDSNTSELEEASGDPNLKEKIAEKVFED